jgi:hypothetical protein
VGIKRDSGSVDLGRRIRSTIEFWLSSRAAGDTSIGQTRSTRATKRTSGCSIPWTSSPK